MESVYEFLVDKENSLIKLFTPAFDLTHNDPGYIKGYVPGVRENGGQYTHGAVWVILAFVLLKDKAKAWELLKLVNPIMHSDSYEKSQVFKVEPYVIAADVYSVGHNAGRGGWTWYTGSASWMYQLIVKHLLGIILKVDKLYFEPFLPEDWKSFKMHYRYKETFYNITFTKDGSSDEVTSIVVDGKEQKNKFVLLVDDNVSHEVEIKLG